MLLRQVETHAFHTYDSFLKVRPTRVKTVRTSRAWRPGTL